MLKNLPNVLRPPVFGASVFFFLSASFHPPCSSLYLFVSMVCI